MEICSALHFRMVIIIPSHQLPIFSVFWSNCIDVKMKIRDTNAFFISFSPQIADSCIPWIPNYIYVFLFSLCNKLKWIRRGNQRVRRRKENEISSVQFTRSDMSDYLRPHGLKYARLPCPSPTPRAYSSSCPLSWWCHPTIPSSVVPFSSCLQSFQHQGMVFSNESVLHISGQSIEVSASASVLPINIQDWFPLGWTGWISLLSKGLSSVFSNTTVQKHQFFGAQPSL